MIKFHKKAEKYLLSLNKSDATRLHDAIENIPFGDIRKLQGTKDPVLYRLRIGKYRIVFCIDNKDIIILKIDTRGDVYK